MFDKILIPLDGSQAAEIVIPYAVELASMFKSSITIIGISESSGRKTMDECSSYLETRSAIIKTKLLQRQPANAADLPQQEVKFECLGGNPASEILNYAERTGCGLIILASHGITGGDFWPLGNIAEKTLRGASCPVLLIKEHLNDSVISLKYILRKILLPLDGSNLSEAAIPLAAGLASETGAEIILFQVLEPISDVGSRYLTPQTIARYNRDLNVSARIYLENINDSLRNKVPSVTVAIG
jgi:nucleotide-binding universal stress UspA family protein